MTIEQYHALTGPARDTVDLLARPGASDADFEPAHAGSLYRAADLG